MPRPAPVPPTPTPTTLCRLEGELSKRDGEAKSPWRDSSDPWGRGAHSRLLCGGLKREARRRGRRGSCRPRLLPVCPGSPECRVRGPQAMAAPTVGDEDLS